MIDIKRAINLATSQLEPYTTSARTDAEALLAHTLCKNRTYLYAHANDLITSPQLLAFQQLVARRSLGVPIAYIIGMREFWSLPLKVNEETLIPRPETELLVEITLQLLGHQSPARILDLGTGSGAIALALAKEHIEWEISACDCSQGALDTAKANASHLGLFNINFFQSDWFSEIKATHTYHAIISNPPYIAANDQHLSKGDLRFEPTIALVGGNNGLSALEHIIEHSLARLEENGLLLIEHGFDQKLSVTTMLKDYGYSEVQCWQDLHGHDRVCGGKRIIS